MSFGFSIGDFLAVFQLASKIRKEFVNAPNQFKQISDDLILRVRNLSIIIHDVDDVLSECTLDTQQKTHLEEIAGSCRSTLIDLEKILSKYSKLQTHDRSLGSNVKRIWERITWEPEDIRELRDRIISNITLLTAFSQRISSQVTFATKKGINRLSERQDDQERLAVLNWLTPVDYALNQSDFIRRRQAGTGQWLLNSPEYRKWLQCENMTLFCPGIPGAGKTILTSIVVEDLSTAFANDKSTGIAYIYCNFKQQETQKVEDLMASLLKQLAQSQSSLPDSVKALHDQHKDRRTRPSLDKILCTLESVALLFSRVFIIVDALDECQAFEGCRTRFLTEVFALQNKSRANIFATSRFIPEIASRFNRSVSLEIRASPEDVRRYIDGHITLLPSFVHGRPDLQEKIKTEIVNAVDGMFLLAQLHLNSLIGKRSPKAIQTALMKLPTGSEAYDYAYRSAMERIEGQVTDQAELAKQVLSWIICAQRPLAILELQHALAVEAGASELDEENLPQVEDMISVCAGLVTVDEENGIIRLVHYTTQEYFERTKTVWFPNSEMEITKICVTYLSFSVFKNGWCQTDAEFEERLQANVLYEYAARNWGHHARKCSSSCQEVIDFLENERIVEAASQALLIRELIFRYSICSPARMTGLHLAAYFGVKEVIASLLSVQCQNIKDILGRTPLWYAVFNRQEAVVTMLLAQDGIDIDACDDQDDRPLCVAAKLGYEAISPLCLAMWRKREAVVRLLLERGAHFDDEDKIVDQTPLPWFVENRHEATTRLLLEKGANIAFGKRINSSRRPLLYALQDAPESVVRLVFGIGVDTESVDTRIKRAPLLRAIRNGHVTVVRLLLDKGADPTSIDARMKWTPLLWAIKNGHPEVVSQLLEKGVDPKSVTVEIRGECQRRWRLPLLSFTKR
ncbi:hypothetical protein F4775DRAFT_586693 [Biscogniauxia sp. FL1348]|nr:hypothetical protein F4775DRAFT_586693 [Biscogniauxia sp. FL1348]